MIANYYKIYDQVRRYSKPKREKLPHHHKGFWLTSLSAGPYNIYYLDISSLTSCVSTVHRLYTFINEMDN